MTKETKKPAPPTQAERTVRTVFWLSLIAALAVFSSCLLLLECFHDEERRIETIREQTPGSDGTTPITITIIFFSVVAAIAAIIIWLVVLVLVRLFDKSPRLIGRPPAEDVSGSVQPAEAPVSLEITPTEPAPQSDDNE